MVFKIGHSPFFIYMVHCLRFGGVYFYHLHNLSRRVRQGELRRSRNFPFSIDQDIKPVYTELKGWNTDMTGITSEEQFPEEFKAYISFLEEKLEVPITIVSVGPDRRQTILRN